MKITKYLVLALLMVSVGKKVLSDRPDIEQVSGGWVTDRHRYDPSLISRYRDSKNNDQKSQQFTVNLAGSGPIAGSYDSQNGTATIEFKNVITTSQSITPPTVSNPNYVMIGSMPNPKKYAGTQNIAGGESANITLWGIPMASKASGSYMVQPLSETTISSKIKKYTPANKTAVMKDGSVYVGVIEYSQAVTPPNLTIPAMQAFATIKNPRASSKQLMGGQSKNVTLWGLKATGDQIVLKSIDKNQTIGYFWPESNIAQLNNGQTIVGIMQELQGTYKKHDAYATGPAWTQYSDEQLDALKMAYKLTPSSTNVHDIGTVKIDGQKNMLRGIILPTSSTTTQSTLALTSRPLNLTSTKQTQMLSDEEESDAVPSSQISSAQAAAAVYNINH